MPEICRRQNNWNQCPTWPRSHQDLSPEKFPPFLSILSQKKRTRKGKHNWAKNFIKHEIRQSLIYSHRVAGTMGQMNHRPSVWCSKYYFFRLFIDLGHLKLFTFIFVFFKKNKQIDWKYFCKEFCKKSWKENNTWNIRRLVDNSFVQSAQRPSVNLS